MAKPVDTRCRAFQDAIEILARPWTAEILGALLPGRTRYSELAEKVVGVSDKMLSARLKELESKGLLVREVDCGPPVRVAYELSASGRAFNDVAQAIERWGRELAKH